jgi:hypothetical protein
MKRTAAALRHQALAAALCLLCCGTISGLAPAADKSQPAETAVTCRVYDGHFESNQSGLKGDNSVVAFADAGSFRKVFGTVPPLMGPRARKLAVKAEDFETDQVAAVIKRGDRTWSYKVEKVTARQGTLTVRYTATPSAPSTARFACPLIISVPKNNYTAVTFIEEGKEIGKAEFKP